ncbi:EF-hand domain-containing protein [Actinokineospora guangxiensis]|uniref:EF-hand domain-containing protein n=1 Tax=Actinokineospora guangxiensis TaxID=1490288 RepID=A0ABW0EVJ3_9PSEU
MRTEALDRVGLVFTLLDANGSGYLSSEDFQLMSDRVVAAAKGSDESAKRAMSAAFAQYWSTLAAELDTDRDNRVTFEEYTACVLSPERFDRTVEQFADSLAALGDPDGDGLIERPVFTALMTAIGFGQANVDALFDAFGPDAHDRVTVATWVRGIKDYYGPDKAGIAGDHLVERAGA